MQNSRGSEEDYDIQSMRMTRMVTFKKLSEAGSEKRIMHCLQILCSWLIFDKLTNCEIAEIDFALLPKPASKAINQSKFFQIRLNSRIHHTALDSAQLMKMHGKAASGDLINFSKVSITFPAGIENLIAENIFNPPFQMSSFIRCCYIDAFRLFSF